MGTQAYLICDTKKTAYSLGKFLGMWTPVDWTETDEATFTKRIAGAWTLSQWTPVAQKDDRARYAVALSAVLHRFCVNHDWAVRVVDEDFFIDDAQLDVRLDRLPQPDSRRLPVYELLGSRWPNAAPLGRGYDLPRP